MENLVFARIDDRLIHGQVVASWLRVFPTVSNILVVDTAAANDPFMQEMFKLLVPSDISIEIHTIESAIDLFKAGFEKPTFMIVKGPQTIKKLIDGGATINHINIGGMGMNRKRKKLFQNISASDEEKDIFRELISKGIKVEIQIIPASKIVNVGTLIK